MSAEPRSLAVELAEFVEANRSLVEDASAVGPVVLTRLVARITKKLVAADEEVRAARNGLAEAAEGLSEALNAYERRKAEYERLKAARDELEELRAEAQAALAGRRRPAADEDA